MIPNQLPNFQGGGVVRSAGGERIGLLGLKKEERELSDDRIFGSGHFVPQVLEKANEVNQKRMDKYSLQTLCQKIISVFGINEEELRYAFKKRAVTEAKTSFSYLAIRKMCYSGREVGQFLNMRSYSAIRISEKGWKKGVQMGTTLPRENLPEEIYKKSKTLNKEQILQVLDFITFLELKEKKGLRKNPLIDFITAEADPEMTLDAVRQQLSGIKGDLANTIIKSREERV